MRREDCDDEAKAVYPTYAQFVEAMACAAPL